MKSTPPAQPAAPSPGQRDIQRGALADLITLLTESASTEAQIDQSHRLGMEQREKDSQKILRDLQHRFDAQAAAVEQRHQERVGPMNARHQDELAAQQASYEHDLQLVLSDFDKTSRDVEEQLRQAVWLAESVFDVNVNQIRQEAKARRKAVQEQSESLDDIEKRGRTLLEYYGQLLAVEKTVADAGSPPNPPGAGEVSARHDAARRELNTLTTLGLPKLFVGASPWLAGIVVLVLVGVGANIASRSLSWSIPTLAGIAGGVLVLVFLLAWLLGKNAFASVRRHGIGLGQAMLNARLAAKAELEAIEQSEQKQFKEAQGRRDSETAQQKARFAPIRGRANQRRDEKLAAVNDANAQRLATIERDHQSATATANDAHVEQQNAMRQTYDQDRSAALSRHESQSRESSQKYEAGRRELEERWKQRLAEIQSPISASNGHEPKTDGWKNVESTGTREFPSVVPVGDLQVDLSRIATHTPFRLPLPEPFQVPALLAFPHGASLLIDTDRSGRERAIAALRMVMARLLGSLPPGRARFTLIDPVGLGQSFAGFMHLADYDDALVGGRIYTDAEQIDQRLRDLTDHMETVIQKYLRNEFETIDLYNAQAGELAEPYRFLVIADFPSGFSPDAIRRLSSIASTGARCGVYTLIARDTRLPIPQGVHLADIESHSIHLVQTDSAFTWHDPVFENFPLQLAAPPDDQALTRLLRAVGEGAKLANRVEVPFQTIAPAANEMWSRSASDELSVPVGKSGATRLQTVRLGKGVAQHVLIGGKTGSGKSTLLHVLVTNIALWYSPAEVEFYLIDFKKGVEFKTYATHSLPHARAIAVESDREFGLSVLQRLDAELARRGELFRKAGVQDLPSFRHATNGAMPRTLLIIDEFQEFFTEDDKLAQEAALLIDRLVRQGRAFGVHVLLGSQTIGGSGLPRSTIGQMAVRVALQTSEADSQLILGDNNSAARLLSRPGEAIYNDAGGQVEGNSPFQVSWLPDDQREQQLIRVAARAREGHATADRPIVFEGNAPADVSKNLSLTRLIEGSGWPAPVTVPLAWVGVPVAIKEPTAIPIRRQSGANVLLVGQHDDAATGILAMSLLSLAAQLPPQSADFYVMDGMPADSPLAGTLARAARSVPHEVRLVEYRGVDAAIADIWELMQQRQGNEPAIFLIISALQRFRTLRKGEEEFSFSMSDEPKKVSSGKQFADILREGPPVGIHTFAWCDTPVALERTLDRSALREFDHRILFQMSATDSSNLIDSPAANRLGFYRALAYSEEQGVTEKFRPYAVPSNEWLEGVALKFAERRSHAAPV